MKAMVLAAGLGVRMRPLTQDRPKPALRVLGRPMIAQVLRRLARASVDTAVVNLHYHPEVLRELLGDGGNDGLPQVRYTFEDPVLGTGGGLVSGIAGIGGGNVIVPTPAAAPKAMSSMNWKTSNRWDLGST